MLEILERCAHCGHKKDAHYETFIAAQPGANFVLYEDMIRNRGGNSEVKKNGYERALGECKKFRPKKGK